MKTCKTCGETKPFTKSAGNAGGYVPNCKPCRNAYNRSKVTQESRRRAHVKHQYGISIEQVNDMRDEQGGCCAICSTPLTNWGHRSGPHIDHCHTTGKVRGLLCASCNLGLGKFRDSTDILERAVSYLRRVS